MKNLIYLVMILTLAMQMSACSSDKNKSPVQVDKANKNKKQEEKKSDGGSTTDQGESLQEESGNVASGDKANENKKQEGKKSDGGSATGQGESLKGESDGVTGGDTAKKVNNEKSLFSSYNSLPEGIDDPSPYIYIVERVSLLSHKNKSNIISQIVEMLELIEDYRKNKSKSENNFLMKELMVNSILDKSGFFILDGQKNINLSKLPEDQTMSEERYSFVKIVNVQRLNWLKINKACVAAKSESKDCISMKSLHNSMSDTIEVYIKEYYGHLSRSYQAGQNFNAATENILENQNLISEISLKILNDRLGSYLKDEARDAQILFNLMLSSRTFWDNLPQVLSENKEELVTYYKTDISDKRTSLLQLLARSFLKPFTRINQYSLDKFKAFTDINQEIDFFNGFLGQNIIDLEKLLIEAGIIDTLSLKQFLKFAGLTTHESLQGLNLEKLEKYISEYTVNKKVKQPDLIKNVEEQNTDEDKLFQPNLLFEEQLKSKNINFSR